ncbi:hypothetical protein [Pseudohaliea sp.]|uniref:hypothetical protein n=1 Tax=Pseudohaliea sp. TaxID=2740289 RepID=UPI0032EEFF87
MAVLRIHQFQAMLDRWDDCMGRTREYASCFERLGASSRLFQVAYGGDQQDMWLVTSMRDWFQAGEISQQLEADPDYQRLRRDDRDAPVFADATIFAFDEIPLPELVEPMSDPLPASGDGALSAGPAIWQVHDFEPLRPRWNDCLARADENSQFMGRAGIPSRLYVAGPGDPAGAMHMLFINELDNWVQFGAFLEYCKNHPGYAEMFEEGVSDSVHTNYSLRTLAEVPL